MMLELFSTNLCFVLVIGKRAEWKSDFELLALMELKGIWLLPEPVTELRCLWLTCGFHANDGAAVGLNDPCLCKDDADWKEALPFANGGALLVPGNNANFSGFLAFFPSCSFQCWENENNFCPDIFVVDKPVFPNLPLRDNSAKSNAILAFLAQIAAVAFVAALAVHSMAAIACTVAALATLTDSSASMAESDPNASMAGRCSFPNFSISFDIPVVIPWVKTKT